MSKCLKWTRCCLRRESSDRRRVVRLWLPLWYSTSRLLACSAGSSSRRNRHPYSSDTPSLRASRYFGCESTALEFAPGGGGFGIYTIAYTFGPAVNDPHLRCNRRSVSTAMVIDVVLWINSTTIMPMTERARLRDWGFNLLLRAAVLCVP